VTNSTEHSSKPDETRLTTAELVADPHNRREHPKRNVEMLTQALSRVGAARSIVIDEGNEVLAGNGVLEAAKQAGISKVHVVEADGHTIIAVRRRGLTAEAKRELAMYDNRTAELAEWNLPQLAADVEAGLDLTPFFFDKELLTMHLTVAGGGGGASPKTQFVIVVTCADEATQTDLLTKFLAEGLTCRAVVS